MRKVLHWLVRLYPQTWRERYEAEFYAMLDLWGVSERRMKSPTPWFFWHRMIQATYRESSLLSTAA
jgi:hypothetical protein